MRHHEQDQFVLHKYVSCYKPACFCFSLVKSITNSVQWLWLCHKELKFVERTSFTSVLTGQPCEACIIRPACIFVRGPFKHWCMSQWMVTTAFHVCVTTLWPFKQWCMSQWKVTTAIHVYYLCVCDEKHVYFKWLSYRSTINTVSDLHWWFLLYNIQMKTLCNVLSSKNSFWNYFIANINSIFSGINV